LGGMNLGTPICDEVCRTAAIDKKIFRALKTNKKAEHLLGFF
jgi:hypothetical protein